MSEDPRTPVLLIVEDSALEVRLIARVLEEVDASIAYRSFLSGADALRWLEAGNLADFALVDVLLPGESGIDVAQRIAPYLAGEREAIEIWSNAPQRASAASGHWEIVPKPTDLDGLKRFAADLIDRVHARCGVEERTNER